VAGTVKHARLESPTARIHLKRGRQAHWQALIEGRVHLGYQRHKGANCREIKYLQAIKPRYWSRRSRPRAMIRLLDPSRSRQS
jgi:hypothetical protein